MAENEKPQKSITVQEEKPINMPFTLENTKVIQSMIGKYGVDEEDVVINALTLLYTISKKCPSAKHIIVQDLSGTINIPLAIVSP
jgi:ribosomal protein L1